MRDLLDEVIAAHRDVLRRGSGDAEEIAVAVRRRYGAGTTPPSPTSGTRSPTPRGCAAGSPR